MNWRAIFLPWAEIKRLRMVNDNLKEKLKFERGRAAQLAGSVEELQGESQSKDSMITCLRESDRLLKRKLSITTRPNVTGMDYARNAMEQLSRFVAVNPEHFTGGSDTSETSLHIGVSQ